MKIVWLLPRWARLVVLGALVPAAGCLYDPDDRCDPNQRLVHDRHCVCVEGAILVDGVCQPCGEHAVAEGNACVCAPGYAADPSGDCVEGVSAAGVPCDEDAPCTDPVFSACVVEDARGGYCTSTGCLSSADCELGFACVLDAEPSYCGRLPDGVGKSCSTQDDCAGQTASYCESLVADACLVAGCTRDEDCYGDWICCDATALLGVALCTPAEECVIP